MTSFRLKTAPAVEPLSTAEVKTHLRISGTAEDVYLGTLITAARGFVEQRLGRALITQTWCLTLDAWPTADRVSLPYAGSLQSIASVSYTDHEGTALVMDSGDYFADTAAVPGQLVLGYGQSWPTETLRPASAITVEYVCGFGDAATDVPQQIKQALLLVVGLWYENREAAADAKYANGLTPVPFAVDALLSPYRVWSF